jgi:uncharacterized protein (TIRG00374 family)
MKLRYLRYVLHVAVIVGLVLAAVNYLQGEAVLNAFASFRYLYAPLMVLLSCAVLFIKGLRFVPLMRPLTDVGRWCLTRGYMAGQPATLVPGGIAARVGLMHQVGVPMSESSIAVAFVGLIDYATYILGAVISAAFFPEARRPALIAVGILAGLGILIWFPPTRDLFRKASDWIARKTEAMDDWERLQEAFEDIATLPVLGTSFGLTVIGTGLDVVILHLALVGAETPLPFPLVFLAYFLGLLLGILSPLPGGLGTADAGMIGVLVTSGGIDTALAAAAIAIFRIATVVVRALLGAVVYVCCWPGHQDGDGEEQQKEPDDVEEK